MEKMYTRKKISKSKITLLACIVMLSLSGIFNSTVAQTIIYSTDFGTVANVNPTGWTFSGIGMNTSTNTPSSGYTGASGSVYLGEGNSTTFTNTSGNQQSSSPVGYSDATLLVNTTGFSTVTIGFAMRKSSASYNSNATYTLEWSSNGTNYNTINYTEPTAGSWGLVSGAGLVLPAGAGNQATLYLRWSFTRTGTGSNYKLDDVTVTGSNTAPPSTISFLSNDTTVNENVASANIYLRLSAVSTVSSAISVSVSVLSNAGINDFTLANTTVTFAANAPVNSTAPITINLNNDVIPESAEYIILRLINPQNSSSGAINQFAFYIGDDDKIIPQASNTLSLNLIGSFSNGLAGANSAEIVAHDPTTQRLFIANSIGAKLDIINFANPASPALLLSVPISTYGNINSIAVKNGMVAAAIENGTNPQDSGKVVFFNTNGMFLKQVTVGMMPDMITFNHAGTKVLTANEGEPNTAYTNDPDGSVSIIDISGGITGLTQANVSHITFTVYNGQENVLRSQGIRIFGLNASASKDFEPEYITVSPDDSKAWIGLQENNALIEINMTNNNINYIKALGTKDHSLLNNGIEASNVTRGVNISNFPVKGFYLPDAIASYTIGGNTYIISANEGDARAYNGFSEERRVSQLTLDPVKFPNGAELKNNYALGRLTVTDKNGDIDNDGDIDTIYVFGSRSFSIWNATTGNQVYDSKDDFEQITAAGTFSNLFNVSNSNATKKDRSDDKGPEPEGVTIGTIGSNIYAFIALERIGGVMVYDVTNPAAPVFVTYVNNRSLPANGPDLGSEGIIFIPQSQSPNGQHIVIAANEVSSTLTFWGIPGCVTPLSTSLSIAGNFTSACSNNPPVLSVPAASGLNYQWSNNGIPVPGATNNTIAPITSGVYSVAINGAINCVSGSIARSVTVNPLPVLTASGNTVVCIGGAITQTLSGAISYSYNTAPSTSVITFTPASSASYTIIGQSAAGCSNSLVKQVVVNPYPIINLYAVPAVICEGQSSTLTATGAMSYSWSEGSNTPAISVSPAFTSTYSVSGTINGCASILTKTITVNSVPLISATASESTTCSGQSVTLTAMGGATYNWNNGSTSNQIIVAPTTTSSYSVVGTNVDGCSATVAIVQNVAICTGIASENTKEENTYLIFPNPANNELTINFNSTEPVNVKIINAIGASVYEVNNVNTGVLINVSQLNKGVYFVQFISGNSLSTKKLVVN